MSSTSFKKTDFFNGNFKGLFLLLSILHISLVLAYSHVVGYLLSADSYRYIHVANEIMSMGPFDAVQNCYTAPGYPLFLGLIQLSGISSMMIVYFFQSLIFCLALYQLVRAMINAEIICPAQGLLLALIATTTLDMISFNGKVLTESLAASGLLFIASLMLRGEKTTGHLFTLGLAAGLLIAVKSEYILVVPVIMLLLYLNKLRTYRLLLPVFAVVSILTLNGFRNLSIYDSFNPLGFAGGAVFYGGNNLNGDGSFREYREFPDYVPDGYLDQLPCIAEDEICECVQSGSVLRKAAADAWKSDPALQLSIIPLKFLKLWSLPAEFDPFTQNSEYRPTLYLHHYFKSDRSFIQNLSANKYIILYWAVLFFALSGFIYRLSMHQWNRLDQFAVLVIAGMTLAYSVPFYGLPRFHVPLLALMLPYSIFTVWFLLRKLRFLRK